MADRSGANEQDWIGVRIIISGVIQRTAQSFCDQHHYAASTAARLNGLLKSA